MPARLAAECRQQKAAVIAVRFLDGLHDTDEEHGWMPDACQACRRMQAAKSCNHCCWGMVEGGVRLKAAMIAVRFELTPFRTSA